MDPLAPQVEQLSIQLNHLTEEERKIIMQANIYFLILLMELNQPKENFDQSFFVIVSF